MTTEEQNAQIIEQLQTLNASIIKQNSKVRIVGIGILSGIGFFIGSAIIATIALGVLGPILGKISWVGDNYSKGSAILQAKPEPTN